MKRSDYADDTATEIDREPHWSSPRPPQAFPVVARGAADPPQISRTVTRMSLEAPASPALPVVPAAFDMRRPLISPPRLPPRPTPFYSYAEDRARQHMDTERVAPLPASDLRRTWAELLEAAWTRFAAPACGAIAGLIFVVGYLAYASQQGAGIPAAAVVAPIVMSTEVAMAPSAVDEVAPRLAVEPTVTVVQSSEPARAAKAMRTAPRAAVMVEAPKYRAVATKRRPIRLNDSTPLGDLRPSRAR